MPIEIAPALRLQEWRDRRFGAVSIDHVFDEIHVAVRDPDGEVVSVSGPEETFALMALANDALPEGDPRKLIAGDLEWFRRLADDTEMYEAQSLRNWARHMSHLFAALLPPR
jgi:hypothetical protein